ncbi:MAG: hypothetical protein ACFFCQ_10130 [Promethearchaeota archaeon]
MLDRKMICIRVTLLLICLFITMKVELTPIIAEYGKITESGTTMVPVGAIFYNLNTSFQSTQFATIDFYPESPHIGRYNIQIQAKIWVDSQESTSDVLVRNLWNVCEPINTVNYDIGFHQEFFYSYSRPTVEDPDFKLLVELTDSSKKAPGWVDIDFINDGDTTPPPDFTMPPSTCSDIDTSTSEETTSTNENTSSQIQTSSVSSGIKRITFPILSSVVAILFFLLHKKRMKNK